MSSYVKLDWPDEPAVIVHGGRRYRVWMDSTGRYRVYELLLEDDKRTVYACRRRIGRRLLGRWQPLAQWRLRSRRPETIERALGRARRACEKDAARRR
ncbi:hypothetical protein JCM19992_21710 [Thermostilla marina]